MKRALRPIAVFLLIALVFTALPVHAEKSSVSRAANERLPQVTSPVIDLLPEWAPFPFLDLDKSLAVFTIPVGAQDAYLIVCDGHAMMLDCSAIGMPPVPDYLLRLLDALGIERLDYAVNTHPHTDHMLGFPDLLAKVPADAFYTIFKRDHSAAQRKLIRQIDALGIPIVDYVPGTPIPLGGAQITTWQRHDVPNDNDRSLIMRIQYGERSILLTADIQLTTQRHFAEELGDAIRSDILKLPHHGIGDLSPKLLSAVDPGLCFASNSEKYKGVKLQRAACEKFGVPLIFTGYVPLVMVTDGTRWQVQVWHEDCIELPRHRLITGIEDGYLPPAEDTPVPAPLPPVPADPPDLLPPDVPTDAPVAV